jgi:uncharacterized protein (TIGR03000 family)
VAFRRNVFFRGGFNSRFFSPVRFGWGWGGWGWGSPWYVGYGSPLSYSYPYGDYSFPSISAYYSPSVPYYASSSGYVPDVTTYEPSPGSYRPIYPPAADDDRPTRGSRTVEIDVRVPSATATLWFNGVKMKQKGKVRSFVSPQLQPGTTYTYKVRAQWKEDGETVEQTRSLQVRAGQEVHVDFTRPAPERLPSPSKGE